MSYRTAVYQEGRRWVAEVAFACGSGLRMRGSRIGEVVPYEADGGWWMPTRRFGSRNKGRAEARAARWVSRREAEATADAERRAQIAKARRDAV